MPVRAGDAPEQEVDLDAYLRRMLVNAHRSWWRTRWRRELVFEPDSSLPLAERDVVVAARPQAAVPGGRHHPLGPALDQGGRRRHGDRLRWPGAFPSGSAGQGAGVGADRVGSWEVANVGVGPDDSWEDRDETQTEDVGLPEHERDEGRRQAGGTGEDDAAEVAGMTDSGLSDSSGLPGHEDDSRRAEDTGTVEQNP